LSDSILARFVQSCRAWYVVGKQTEHNWPGRQRAYRDLSEKHGYRVCNHVKAIKAILDAKENATRRAINLPELHE